MTTIAATAVEGERVATAVAAGASARGAGGASACPCWSATCPTTSGGARSGPAAACRHLARPLAAALGPLRACGRPRISTRQRLTSTRSGPSACRPDDVRYMFEKYGDIRDVYMPMDYYTK
jgi:hypothetical protein